MIMILCNMLFMLQFFGALSIMAVLKLFSTNMLLIRAIDKQSNMIGTNNIKILLLNKNMLHNEAIRRGRGIQHARTKTAHRRGF